MSKFLRYEACPKCRSIGRDNRGDNLGVFSDGSVHCFSCGYHKFPASYKPKEVVPYGPKNLLPADFTREVPTRAFKWLLQYGLPYSYWQPYTGYSASFERLVFTVGTPLVFSIGRYVGDDKSKRKWYVWGDAHKHCERIGTGDSVVLVEDIVSAHKVGAAGYEAIPLFGTRVFGDVVHYSASVNKPIYLWLDKDQEAHTKWSALRLQMLTGNPVHIVHTEKDPKWLSVEQIKKELNENS